MRFFLHFTYVLLFLTVRFRNDWKQFKILIYMICYFIAIKERKTDKGKLFQVT